MIGNGESISYTYKGKFDVIYKHRDGSMGRETWDLKIVPQLNHDEWKMEGKRSND